jgi:hypothetical protein
MARVLWILIAVWLLGQAVACAPSTSVNVWYECSPQSSQPFQCDLTPNGGAITAGEPIQITCTGGVPPYQFSLMEQGPGGGSLDQSGNLVTGASGTQDNVQVSDQSCQNLGFFFSVP